MSRGFFSVFSTFNKSMCLFATSLFLIDLEFGNILPKRDPTLQTFAREKENKGKKEIGQNCIQRNSFYRFCHLQKSCFVLPFSRMFRIKEAPKLFWRMIYENIVGNSLFIAVIMAD